MRWVAFDTETHLIKPGCPAPRLVCVQVASVSDGGGRGTGYLLNREDGVKYIGGLLRDESVGLVCHHAPFDLAVVCAEDPSLIAQVYRAIDQGRIRDTLLREKIIRNALGKLKYSWDDELGEYKKQRFDLATLVMRYLGRHRDKGGDTWRLRYRELDGVPLSEWPKEAVDYAIWDAEDTAGVYCAQHSLEPNIIGEDWQTEAAWSLYTLSLWGLRADRKRVSSLKEKFLASWMTSMTVAREWGLVRDDEKSTKDTKAISAAIQEWYKVNDKGDPPATPTGKVSMTREVLTCTDHPGLLAVAEMGKWRKLLTTYIPILEQGTEAPINPRYNPILETFRVSCARPNIQNQPRDGGIRECFVPRDGWLYCFCDYSTIELRALAQVCIWLFGHSDMAEALRDGKDLHLDMACQLLGIPYGEGVDRLRQGDKHIKFMRDKSKITNFGVPGGMGAEALMDYAKGYGVELTIHQARELREAFLSRWTAIKEYFDYVSGLMDGDRAEIIQFVGSNMLRGKVSYTAACNGFFQHLAAMGAKQALYRVARESDTDPTSVLYGCAPMAFIHDEIGMEIPPWIDPHDAAMRLRDIMVSTMQEWIPDIPIEASPVLMRRWLKGASPTYKDGRLVPTLEHA